MAIGSALLFNIRLPINFNSPYKALSIQDFWRRWHITLSRWLRHYVYIPLGGSRCSKYKVYRNLFLTALVSGVWHGAGTTFIIWGALHGIAMVIHRGWSSCGLRLPNLVAWFVTFNFVNIAWVVFRAPDLNIAYEFICIMLGSKGYLQIDSELVNVLGMLLNTSYSFPFVQSSVSYMAIPAVLLTMLLTLILKNSHNLVLESNVQKIRYVVFFGFIFGLSVSSMLASSSSVFLYFNF